VVLADRVAIVTGAGNGIGRAIALAMVRAGARVVAADVDGGAAKATADAAAGLGGKSLALDTDVGDLAAIDRMALRAVEAFGRVDVLVNNAGVTRRAGIMDLTEQDWDRIMRVNAKGVFFCLQRVARARHQGRVQRRGFVTFRPEPVEKTHQSRLRGPYAAPALCRPPTPHIEANGARCKCAG